MYRADRSTKWPCLWGKDERLQTASTKSAKGRCAYFAGASAEDAVARLYLDQGYQVAAQRWRCPYGEVDLILQRGGAYVFVEVKKSRSFHGAALRITQRQVDRIHAAAMQFAGQLASGQLTQMRFDAALVNDFGQVDIRENALCSR